jgi:transposase-like protein
VRVDTPRDRNGTFEPQIVRKRQRRFEGFDEKILALYARGLSTRDIEAHLAEIYGVKVGRDLISRVTDAVMEDARPWQTRPLEDGRFLGIVANPDRKESRCRIGRGIRLRRTRSAATSS